jgi:hypothetical protein
MKQVRVRRWVRIAVVGAGLGVAVALSGCAHAPVVGAQAPGPANPPGVAPSTAPSTVPPTTDPTPDDPASDDPTPGATHLYDEARAQWKQGAGAVSAQQGAYWLKAASDLQAGADTDGGDTSGYPQAINELTDLASLPDAQQTPAQNAQYHQDIDDLNAFFGTPGLYG